MRPFYESDEDREQEKEIISAVAGSWNVDFVKMKISCIIDYALIENEKVVAVVEVRRRNYSKDDIDRLGGLIIGTGKIFSAKKWIGIGIPFIFVVKLKEEIFYIVIKNEEDWPVMNIEMGGTRKRNDWQDIEPCCLMPMNIFTKWSEKS